MPRGRGANLGGKDKGHRGGEPFRRAGAAERCRPRAGPFRPSAWRSCRVLTSVLAVVQLAGLTIMVLTGLLSYASYSPRLPGNDQTPGAGLLKLYLFSWPTHPARSTRRVPCSMTIRA